MRVMLIGGIVFSLVSGTGSLAHAGGAAPNAQQGSSAFRLSTTSGNRLYTIKKNGYVERTALPVNSGKTAAQRLTILRQSMEDEIEGVGHFQNDADTPAFEIISHGPTLHQVAEAGYGSENAHQNGGISRYQVKASELANGKLDVTVMLPVSGHVGIQSAQTYAKTNVFRLQHNGGAWESIPAQGKYVTEVKRTLELKPGLNKLLMEPYAGGFNGYDQGRTVEIEVLP